MLAIVQMADRWQKAGPLRPWMIFTPASALIPLLLASATTGPCTMRLIRFLIALLCIAAGVVVGALNPQPVSRSEEHTSELQSLMRISYAVFCLKKKNNNDTDTQ